MCQGMDPEKVRTGHIGEEAVYHALKKLGHKPRRAPTYNERYDIEVNGLKVDVKTQKTKNALFDPNANMHRMAKNFNDCADVIVWVNYATERDATYIKGCLEFNEFLEKAVLKKAGTHDGDSGFVWNSETYVVKLGQLKPLESVFGGSVQEKLIGGAQ